MFVGNKNVEEVVFYFFEVIFPYRFIVVSINGMMAKVVFMLLKLSIWIVEDPL